MSQRKRSPATAKSPKSSQPSQAADRRVASTARPAGHADRPQSQRGRHRRAFRHAHGLRPGRSRRAAAADAAEGLPANVRRFGANSCDLIAIADWLTACGVTTVAMESTGVYWIPLFELLESRGFEVYLVEPGQLSRCGARPKTDVLDVQWIQRLHTYGLLRPSFRPPDSIMALRGYHRQRQMQIRYAASHVQHMQKALEQMNVKLTEVAGRHHRRDRHGGSSRPSWHGERDPREAGRAARRPVPQRRGRRSPRPWKGPGGRSTCSPCSRPTSCISFTTGRSPSATSMIEAELAKLPNRAGDKPFEPKPRKRRPQAERPDASRPAGPLFKALGVDLTEIEGIDVATALVILAEIGVDVSRFPTEKHFASWLGVCPRQYESNKTQEETQPAQGEEPDGDRPADGGPGVGPDAVAAGPCSTGGSRAGSAARARSRRRLTSWRAWSTGCSSTARSTSSKAWRNTSARSNSNWNGRCVARRRLWATNWSRSPLPNRSRVGEPLGGRSPAAGLRTVATSITNNPDRTGWGQGGDSVQKPARTDILRLARSVAVGKTVHGDP